MISNFYSINAKQAILVNNSDLKNSLIFFLKNNEIVSRIFVKRIEHFFSTNPDAVKVFMPFRTLKIKNPAET